MGWNSVACQGFARVFRQFLPEIADFTKLPQMRTGAAVYK
jgi:hypothetical protein